MATQTTYTSDDLRAVFTRLKPHVLFKAMEATTESSPWHREASVLVHTQMVMEEYIISTNAAVGRDWSRSDFLGGLACIWHDTGKPPAMIIKHSAERGEYKAFHGHEILSARLFENFYMSSKDEREYLGLHQGEIFAVGWMIQNHMPWASAKQDHLKRIRATATVLGVYDAYIRALQADQRGRLADDQEAKLYAADQWLTQLSAVYVDDMVSRAKLGPVNGQPELVLAIGPSGAGKSTHFSKVYEPLGYEKFSLDSLRHEFYDTDDYATAYAASTEDTRFSQKANNRFLELVRAGKRVYVDNTNLSPKRRAFYISEARRRGYYVMGDVVLSSLVTIVARQKTRDDKDVPESAVKQQYMSVHLPDIGEVDSISVITTVSTGQ